MRYEQKNSQSRRNLELPGKGWPPQELFSKTISTTTRGVDGQNVCVSKQDPLSAPGKGVECSTTQVGGCPLHRYGLDLNQKQIIVSCDDHLQLLSPEPSATTPARHGSFDWRNVSDQGAPRPYFKEDIRVAKRGNGPTTHATFSLRRQRNRLFASIDAFKA